MEETAYPVRPAVPVCDRCKQRRQKCNKGMDGCASCTAAGASCCFTDPESGLTLPRLYVKQLEERIIHLRARKGGVTHSKEFLQPTTPVSVSSPVSDFSSGRVGRRYLGDSSGLIFIRSCIDLATSEGILNRTSRTDRAKLRVRKVLGALPQLLPPSHGIPLTKDTMQELFKVFSECSRLHPILLDFEFQSYLSRFLEGNPNHDPMGTACVHMVFSIAMSHLGKAERNTTASKLAEIYYQRVLEGLHRILHPRSLQSLQILLLILHFSLSNPQQPVVWHLVGYALRLATVLQLHKEPQSDLGDTDVDLRRRLFWSLYSIDRAVGNTLGRPTGLSDTDILTPFPNAPMNASKSTLITNHCFKLRQLQSNVADVLYQCILPCDENFIEHTQHRIDYWLESVPSEACSSDMLNWFNHAYHNLLIFLHRPSVANPMPSSRDILHCFNSAQEVLRLYWKLYRADAVDCTWMAIHWLFLAGIVHLYSIWTLEDIRNNLDWSIVLNDTQTTSMVLAAMAERWTSAEGVPQVYHDLCMGTFQKYGELYPQHDSDSLQSSN